MVGGDFVDFLQEQKVRVRVDAFERRPPFIFGSVVLFQAESNTDVGASSIVAPIEVTF